MDLNEEVARVAYELWEKRGRGPDKDQEDWNTAESIVKAQHGQPGAGTEEVAEEESIITEKTASKKASEKSANGKTNNRSKRRNQDGTSKKFAHEHSSFQAVSPRSAEKY